MRILATQYTLNNKAFEIYVAGCKGNPHCEGCFSPETWDFNQGDLWEKKYQDKINSKIIDYDCLIDNIMIFGGEPLDQSIQELSQLLDIGLLYNKKTWIFTHYDFEKAKKILKKSLCKLDYIKCGAYIPHLKCDNNIQYGIKLATSNQHIYKKGKDF